jgi:hypothetical protein
MISKLSDAFCIDESDLEMMMLAPLVLEKINKFFSVDGPNKIIVTVEAVAYEASEPGGGDDEDDGDDKEGSDRDDNEVEKVKKPKYRLEIHAAGDFTATLRSTAVYFMKNRKGLAAAASGAPEKCAIDPVRVNDGALSFGVVRDPLESLEAVVRSVYKPMIQEMNLEVWGQATTEQKAEFIGVLDGFTKNLQDNIRSLTGGLELQKPDEKVETMTGATHYDPVVITQCVNLLQDWCESIEHYLNDTERRWETPDSGPDSELEHWRSRMQR